MALKLDNSLLEELGLGSLPESEKQLLLRQIYERLEMNVGMRLADQMSNEQLDAFEKFVDANDDKGAFQWLETNFPNYKDVVNEEFEKLKNEIRTVAPQILASVSQQQAQAGAQQPPQGAAPAPVPAPQPAPMAAPGQNYGYGQPQYGAPAPAPGPQSPYGASQAPQYPPQQPGYGPQPQPGQPQAPQDPGQYPPQYPQQPAQ